MVKEKDNTYVHEPHLLFISASTFTCVLCIMYIINDEYKIQHGFLFIAHFCFVKFQSRINSVGGSEETVEHRRERGLTKNQNLLKDRE